MESLKQANENLERSEEERERMIKEAAEHYGKFMDIVIPGWRGRSHSQNTPLRVSKSFINDLCKSLHSKPPKITDFSNDEGYDGIIVQCNIPVKSLCEHHHLPIAGFAHVSYLPADKDTRIIGLSKLNRIVSYWSQRPQTQEHLTMQIHRHIDKLIIGNRGVAVAIQAAHFCTCHRAIYHDSEMHTAKMSGVFFSNEIGTRDEFYRMISLSKK